jgi:hypothetical protein
VCLVKVVLVSFRGGGRWLDVMCVIVNFENSELFKWVFVDFGVFFVIFLCVIVKSFGWGCLKFLRGCLV